MTDCYVQAQSDNLPKLDGLMLMEFSSQSEEHISAEIRNIKSSRSMRADYVLSAVGRVCLKREGVICKVKGEVCPEHRQHSRNYQVSLTVDEEEEKVLDLMCHDCAASKGGCKHALAFLMWIHTQSMKPAPTDVESYWNKPKLSKISAVKNLKTAEFGTVKDDATVDFLKFKSLMSSPTAPLSSFQRYHSEIEQSGRLDLHYLIMQFLRECNNSHTPDDFRRFAEGVMTPALCEQGFRDTSGQNKSRLWHILRFGRMSASRFYDAARSKKEDGGVLKEIILGASTIDVTDSMKRGQLLEKEVLKVVQKKRNLKVSEVGIKLSGHYPEFGASPDGLSEEYVIEIKCPRFQKTKKNYIKGNQITNKFLAQINLQMFLCGKTAGLFCIADPDFEKNKKVDIITIKFDQAFISNIMEDARKYWDKHIFPVLLNSAVC